MDKPKLIKDLGVMQPTPHSAYKKRMGLYECPLCGGLYKAIKNNADRSQSCGCGRAESTRKAKFKHGLKGTKLYNVWKNIKRRCYRPQDKSYIDYGARGIIVCAAWKDNFVVFHDWSMKNGYKDGLQIDRIDVNGDYEPSNCRWVAQYVNAQNKRKRKCNTSGYIGVAKKWNKWSAMILDNGTLHRLGSFNDIKDAAIAYNNYIIENHTFHRLNVIED